MPRRPVVGPSYASIRSKTGATSSQPHPLAPSFSQCAKSSAQPRTQIAAFSAWDPPSTLPRGRWSNRFAAFFWGRCE